MVGLGAVAFVAVGFADANACTITTNRKIDEPKQRAQKIGVAKKFIKQVSSKDWGGITTSMGDEPWSLNGRQIEPSNTNDLKGAITAALLPDFVSFEFQGAAVIGERVYAGATLWFDDPESDCGSGPFGTQHYLTFKFGGGRVIGVDFADG